MLIMHSPTVPRPSLTMKTAALTICTIISMAAHSVGQTVISQWTFETNPPADVTDSSTGPSVTADFGNGTATGFHASNLTDWTTPAGNGSANSLNANNWAAGDYFQFTLSTSGYEGISVSWDQTRSSTGPATFDLLYSTDGGSNFSIALNDYTVGTTGWSAGTAVTTSSFAVDLSSNSDLNNVANLVFRLVADSAAGGAAGTVRVDNFTVSAIPEPSTYAMMGLGAMLLVGFQRFRRKS